MDSSIPPAGNSRSDHYKLVLALAMQSSNMGAWERDVATNEVWWSPELEKIFGLEVGAFPGTEDAFFDLIYPDDRPHAFSQVQAAIAERRSFSYEFRFHHADGSLRWMEGRGQAIYHDDGTPYRLYGVGIDITERKSAEEKSRLLTDLNNALQQITDADEIMSVTARILGDHLDVERCAYAEVEDEETFVIVGDHSRGVSSIVGRWPVAAFGTECSRSMLDNEPYVVSDSEHDPRISAQDLEAYRATNIRSVICMPLHKNGKFTAAMAVHRTRPYQWAANEIEVVKLVVNRCWESLERTRSGRKIRESNARFRLALSSGAITVYEQDTDLRYRWLYPEMYGDVIGKTDLDLADGSSGHELSDIKLAVMASREARRAEVKVFLAGQEIWYDLLIEPRFDANGEVTGVGGAALNITDRKVAEERLTSSAERLNLALSAADLGDWTWDAGTDAVGFSERASEIFGVPHGEPLTWTGLRDVLAPEDRERAAKAVEHAVETRDKYNIEYRVIRPSGEIGYVSALGRATYSPDGTPIGMYGIVQDITERKKLENELLDSEARFRGLMEQAPMSIQLYDATGKHIQVNRAWEELWGLKFTDIPDYNVLEDPQLEEKGVAAVLRKVFAGEIAELPLIAYDTEETIPGKSKNEDTTRWVSAIAYPLKGPDGRVQEVALVHQDVTEQKKAEREITFQKTVLESLTETVLDGILIVSPDGKLMHFNQRFVDIWNFPAEIVNSRSDEDALRWAAEQTTDPESFLSRVREIYSDRSHHAREEVEMVDGRVFERFGAPVFHGDTQLGFVWTFSDITDRKRIEQDLERRVRERTQQLASTNEQLRVEIEERARTEQERLDLLKRIFTIQEDERGRIARDIHDHLGQRLTALRFKAALLKSSCADDEQLARQTDELQEIAERLDTELGFVAWELRPSILDDLSFVEAIGNYVGEWSRHSGIDADLHQVGAAELSLSKDVETNLYRIVQEALNNTAKHSQATTVNVLLEQRAGELLLIIEDNGVGIKASGGKSRRHGLGLRGMRERASLVGASIEIESSEAGTSLFLRVPIPAAEERRTPKLTGEFKAPK